MGHEEEIELAINDLRLLNEASVNVGTLGRIVDEVLTIIAWRLLEESLPNALIDNNQGNFRVCLCWGIFVSSILNRHDTIQLS